MIFVDNIYKKLGKTEILKGLSLKVNYKDTFVIIGPSGCGKSVLLKHICGLIKPDKGTIKIFDKFISSISIDELQKLRKKIGFVFQNAALFDSLNVYDNLAFALRRHFKLNEDEIEFKIYKSLKEVGLPETSKLMPSDLSGGMKKRIGLARALILEPKIILYDEPTTGLDPVMTTIIDELICKISEDKKITSVIVTHDLNSVKRTATRIAMHYNGIIIEDKPKEDFFNSENEIVQQFIKGLSKGPIRI